MGVRYNSFAISQVIAAVVIWAASFIAMKIAVAELGAFPTIFLRMLLAVAVLLFFIPGVKKATQNYQKGDGWLLFGLVLAEPCLYFVFEGLALTYTSASEAGMITALHPFMVTVCAYYFLKESINRRMVIGGLMAVAGAILLSVTGESSEAGANHMLGNSLEFIAICFATAYSLLARKLASRYSAVFLTSIQAIFGCLFFLPLALMFNPGMPETVSTEVIVSVLFLAWGVNVIAFILYNASLKSMPASQVGVWMNLLPLATLFFGWLLLGETLTQWQYAAVLLVLGGLGFSQLKPKPKTVFIEQSAIKPEMIDEWLAEHQVVENASRIEAELIEADKAQAGRV